MPVLVTCPSCGKQTSVSRKFAGKTVRCPGCQGSMTIPAPQAAPPPQASSAFICSVCGASFPVEQVFDQQGTIICRSCYAKEAARSATVAGAGPTAAIVTCQGCGGSFHQADVQQQIDGSVVCPACAAASEVPTLTYTPSQSTGISRRKKKSAVPGALIYAVVIAGVIVCGVWFAKKYQAQHSSSSPSIDQFEVVKTTPTTIAPTTAPASRPAELSIEERTYAPAIRDLLAEASRSDQAGDLEGSSRKYRDAFELSMKIPPAQRSEALQKDLATAQVAWRAVTYQRQSSLNGDAPPGGQNPTAMTTRPPDAADQGWEASHKKEVADLLDQAEASANGDKTVAFIKYTDLFKYVGQHLEEIKDSSLKQRLAKASEMRTQLASAMQVPATGNAPPAETESPTSPARAGKQTVAFAVDRTHLLTAAEPLGGASKVKMEDPQGNHLMAKVVATDHGLALLEINPKDVASPGLNYLNLAEKFAAITLRCVALANDNVFTPTPELLKSNSFAPPRPKEPWFVSFKQHPRLPGAPLINSGGELVGMLVSTSKDKPSHLPALDLATLHDFLVAHQALPADKNSDSDPLAVYEASPESN